MQAVEYTENHRASERIQHRMHENSINYDLRAVMQKLNRIKMKLCKWSEASAAQRAESFFQHTRDHTTVIYWNGWRPCTAEEKKCCNFFFFSFANETHTHKFTNLFGHPRPSIERSAILSLWHKWRADCADTLLMYTQRWCMELTEPTPKVSFGHCPESSCGSPILRSPFSPASTIFISLDLSGERLVWVMRYGDLFQTKAQFLRTIFYVSSSEKPEDMKYVRTRTPRRTRQRINLWQKQQLQLLNTPCNQMALQSFT